MNADSDTKHEGTTRDTSYKININSFQKRRDAASQTEHANSLMKKLGDLQVQGA